MAKILSTETSPYIDKQIEIYSKNKVGQYAKYLDKNPVFTTYYHINQVMSGSDIGLGSTKDEIGPNSSVRYNKIENFPLIGLSDLKPDAQYDETGLDVDMDVSGVSTLPGTIKPIPGDFIYLKYVNMESGILFRVTNRELTSIQANDFHQIDLELKATSDPNSPSETYRQLERQVVETYTCIFENIGTEDKCILRLDEYQTALEVGNFLMSLIDYYKSAYYKREVGTFAYYGIYSDYQEPRYFYDLNLIKFLKDTDLFNRAYSSDGIVALCYDDILPQNFELTYQKLLWGALVNKTARKLKKYEYYSLRAVVKLGSPFNIYADGKADIINPFIPQEEIPENSPNILSGILYWYFNKDLTTSLVDHINLPDTATYQEKIIYDYINNNGSTTIINLAQLSDIDFSPSINDYLTTPMLIYILSNYYNSFFDRSEEKNWTDILYGQSQIPKTNK